jgi:hypothetical protein
MRVIYYLGSLVQASEVYTNSLLTGVKGFNISPLGWLSRTDAINGGLIGGGFYTSLKGVQGWDELFNAINLIR